MFVELNLAPSEYRALRTKLAIEALDARGHAPEVIAALLRLTLEELEDVQRHTIALIPGRTIDARCLQERKCGVMIERGRISLAVAPSPRSWRSIEELMACEGLSRREARRAFLDQPQTEPPATPSSSPP